MQLRKSGARKKGQTYTKGEIKIDTSPDQDLSMEKKLATTAKNYGIVHIKDCRKKKWEDGGNHNNSNKHKGLSQNLQITLKKICYLNQIRNHIW